ncbi:MAG: hypothetical protein QW056_06090, partial [Candidatus Bathyarchaeia archaeon]
VLEYNPAQAIVDAAVHGVAPGKGQTTGFAAFQKLETSNLSPEILYGICSMEGVLTPPLEMPSYAFIEAYGLTLHSALNRLYRVKRRLKQHARGGDTSA